MSTVCSTCSGSTEYGGSRIDQVRVTAENCYLQSIKGKLRDDLLEMRVLTGQRGRTHNGDGPHISPGHRLVAPNVGA